LTASPDLLVVGAGAMGAWTAFWAGRSGLRTALVDAYGVAHPRATSGDETRMIRSAHGRDVLYPRWSRQSLRYWREFGEEWGSKPFIECGFLWFTRRPGGFVAASEATLAAEGIPTEHVSPDEIEARWPQVSAAGLTFALYEPEAGVIRARRAIRATVEAFVREGGSFELVAVQPGRVDGDRLLEVVDQSGVVRSAGSFVFACGPWLPRLFPAVLGSVIRVTKQDVLFLGPAGGDDRYRPEALPAWVDYDGAFYGLPAVDNGGVKVGPDRFGPAFDPSSGERIVDPESVRLIRRLLATRIPALAGQPIVETRVCQYESTPDTHFVIDRHPDWSNVWLVGGGSGHGFKHGPQIGRYVVDRLHGAPLGPDEERFTLARPRIEQPGMRMAADSTGGDWQGY
jgi:sarcosine oxidase